jgi:hypothetical protein
LGYFHIDIAEVQAEDGKLYMFVSVDRTSTFAYAELHPREHVSSPRPCPTKSTPF